MRIMTLLKAYLFNTDNPYLMLKCWYEDMTGTIWKEDREAKESYQDILREIITAQGSKGTLTFKDPSTGGTRKLTESTLISSLNKLLQNKEIKQFLDKKSIAGDIPRGNKPPQPSKSGMKSTFFRNLIKIKTELRPFAKDPKFAQHINRIFAAVDKQIDKLPTKPSQIRNYRPSQEEYEDSSDELFERKLAPYRKLLKDLQEVATISDSLSIGEMDEEGKVVYPKKAVRVLDKLFDYGPRVIQKLDEFAEHAEDGARESLGALFANSGTANAREARQLDKDILEILNTEVKILNDEGKLEDISLLEAIQDHLYAQFTGKTAFKSQKEARSVYDKLRSVRQKRMGAKRAKARRLRDSPDQSMSAKLRRFNSQMQSAHKYLKNLYFTLGLKEDRLGGRWLNKHEDNIRETINGINAQNRYVKDWLDYDDKDADAKAKIEDRYYMAFRDLPDREENIQKGRDKKERMIQENEERRIEEEAQQLLDQSDDIMEQLMREGSFTNM